MTVQMFTAKSARGAGRALSELRKLARQHAEKLIEQLATLAEKAESESVRVTAIKEMLDRGFGRVSAEAEGDADNPREWILAFGAKVDAKLDRIVAATIADAENRVE